MRDASWRAILVMGNLIKYWQCIAKRTLSGAYFRTTPCICGTAEEHITCHEVEKDKCLEDVLYLTCPVFVGIPQQEPEAMNKKTGLGTARK